MNITPNIVSMSISKVILFSLFVGLLSSGITFALTTQVQTVKPQKIMTSEPLISPSTKIPFYSPSPTSSLSAVSPTQIVPTVNPINSYLTSIDLPAKIYKNEKYGFTFNYPHTLSIDNKMEISGTLLGNKKIYVEVAQNSLQSCKTNCDVIKKINSLRILDSQVDILLGAKKSADNQLSGQYLTYEFYPKNGYWTYITLKFDNDQPTLEQTAILQQITSSFNYLQIQNNQTKLDSLFQNSLPVTGKPVIYLYPLQEQNIYVKLDYQGKLLSSYPTYDYSINGWKVKVFPDGKIVNLADGQEYSYIFWDEETALNMYDLKRGFVVAGKDTKVFLQNKLKEIGLIPKEYNEFIVYWLPKLQKNTYNLIYFAGEEYTDTAKLDIYPKPDSLLRVFMAYKPLKDKINIPSQEFKPFVRKGFTAVEWGGREIE